MAYKCSLTNFSILSFNSQERNICSTHFSLDVFSLDSEYKSKMRVGECHFLLVIYQQYIINFKWQV